jgi:hypothetical protein
VDEQCKSEFKYSKELKKIMLDTEEGGKSGEDWGAKTATQETQDTFMMQTQLIK